MSAVQSEMPLSKGRIALLVTVMLGAGCSNSLLSKYQDMQCVANCGSAHEKKYEQPIYQTLTMFAGETFCLVALYAIRYARRQSFRKSGGNKYSKLATVDDSGVVLDYGVQEEQDEQDQAEVEQQHEQDDGVGVHAHKGVVGPDELVPGEAEDVQPLAQQLSGVKALLMWMPAMFDICGTTLMNVGLLWVPVSVYQMLRGALVLWVGLFSVLFLNRRLPFAQWASLFIVMLGVAVVGASNIITGAAPAEEGAPPVDLAKAIVGALLVLFAQIFTASQFVIEEKIMTRYSVEPLRAVGLEGIFGLMTSLLLMPILYFTLGNTASGQHGYFDIVDGLHQTFSNPTIWYTSIAIAFSIAFFNFSGLAVTKSVSATARSLIDTCRTIGIWAVSLFLGWEQLALLQVLGFTLLVYGTLCFNEVIALPFFLGGGRSKDIADTEADFQADGAYRDVSETHNSVKITSNDTADERTALLQASNGKGRTGAASQ